MLKTLGFEGGGAGMRDAIIYLRVYIYVNLTPWGVANNFGLELIPFVKSHPT